MRGLFLSILLIFAVPFQEPLQEEEIRVMFWNVENYFDPFDDEKTNDEDFIYGGRYRWSWKRFLRKRNAIAKVIASSAEELGGWPDLIGLCEVENRMVLRQLVKQTHLVRLEYDMVHYDSPDVRGIDVALLYRKERFKVLNSRAVTVSLPDSSTTRDILYVCGIPLQGEGSMDTLHIFVNHWPSRLSDDSKLSSRRMTAANALREAVDSVRIISPEAEILIMGDFNDTPDSQILVDFSKEMEFYVPAADLAAKGLGSIKYKGVWELIDQFFLSENLSGMLMRWNDGTMMRIFAPAFLLEEDREFLGQKPRRTYIGPRYNGGVSDHLPILLRLQRKLHIFAQ
ncbi:MAG: endonuclease [Bacteroidales bacterium]|jgi:endonuclease/exonuclease/phosphatase family metal-dependent hydrolase|nr:endonuclease [Bacteroidales bacterium]